MSANIADVYLTNDLGFPKEDLSMIKMILTPINIAMAFILGHFSQGKPFTFQFLGLTCLVLASSYDVLFLLGTFPDKENFTYLTSMHVIVVCIAKELASNFEFVSGFGLMT